MIDGNYFAVSNGLATLSQDIGIPFSKLQNGLVGATPTLELKV
jgi:hypothetical protein